MSSFLRSYLLWGHLHYWDYLHFWGLLHNLSWLSSRCMTWYTDFPLVVWHMQALLYKAKFQLPMWSENCLVWFLKNRNAWTNWQTKNSVPCSSISSNSRIYIWLLSEGYRWYLTLELPSLVCWWVRAYLFFGDASVSKRPSLSLSDSWP